MRDAFLGVRRFSDFAAHLGLPRAVLADRLKSLADAGVLASTGDGTPVGVRDTVLRPGLGLKTPGPGADPVSAALMDPHRLLQPLLG